MSNMIQKDTVSSEQYAALEKRIAVLEEQLAALQANAAVPGKAGKAIKKNSPEKKKSDWLRAKKANIQIVAEKTGLSLEEATTRLEKAMNVLKITSDECVSLDLYAVEEDALAGEYEKKTGRKPPESLPTGKKNAKKAPAKKPAAKKAKAAPANTDKAELRKARLEAKKAKYMPIVMEHTGWDAEKTEAAMERAMEVAGASYEHYAIYRFWELSEEEQKTYFTKRDAVLLRRKYNTNREIVETMRNKDLCCKRLDAFLGRPWLTTKDMTFEAFSDKFAGEKKIVYKPLASSGGHGVQVIEAANRSAREVFDQLMGMPSGIIEGYLVQHPEMKKLSLNSVNTIRVVTICPEKDMNGMKKGKVNFIYAGVRMGQGTSHVDNLHSGGLMAAVDVNTGIVLTGGVDHTNKMHYIHPDTKVQIKGFQLPLFDEVKKLIEQASKDTPGYFGWDIALTEKGPVIVEVNTSPGADGLQTPFVPEKKGMRYLIEKYL